MRNSFIKILAKEKGETVSSFIVEKPPRERDDSYFTLSSYAGKAGYSPFFLRELDHYLVTMTSGTNPVKEVGKYLLNVTDKLGNIFYAKEKIDELNKQYPYNYIEIRYHITYAIISCKACFDGLATIINEVYDIGYSKGNIDLSTIRSNFLSKIEENNDLLGKKLKKYQNWINKITRYRDLVVHNIMLHTPPIMVKTISGTTRSLKCKIPSKLVGISESAENIKWINAEEFCQSLLDKLLELIQLICEDLLQLIKTKKYFPL